MTIEEEKGKLFIYLNLTFKFSYCLCLIFSLFAAYERLVTEYEILRKAILENNVKITKRIINDLNIDKETVVNFAPNEQNSLLFL